MKVLHVGWGYKPFRGGGLIEYAEDLMQVQARNGYDVSYFCTGKSNIFVSKSKLKRWTNKGYKVFEVINPTIVSSLDNGVFYPAYDTNEPITEKFFLEVVNEVQPDVVHFQEFLGIPTSLIDHLKKLNIKTVFTVGDYFVLCPTVKLIKSDKQTCRITGPELGRQCNICCTNALENGLRFRFYSSFPGLFNSKTWQTLKSVKNHVLKKTPVANAVTVGINLIKEEEFNNRRAINLMALENIDVILPVSNKVASIFRFYKPLDTIKVLHITLDHISLMQPVRFIHRQNEKIVFGIINVIGSLAKGNDLIFDVFDKLMLSDIRNKLEFKIFGYVKEEYQTRLKVYPFVKVIGKYKVKELSTLLEKHNINVGIVPSMWEEAYGLVGIEFLAKGIPVIGNNMGGIPDYVKNAETGWLNQTATAEEMFNIVSDIVNSPSEVERLSYNLIHNREKYIKTLNAHFSEINTVYSQLLNEEVTYS